MIILVTGQPRHGKSQYSIKLLLDLIKDNEKRLNDGKLPRDIYCNIAGVNAADTKTKLPSVQNQDEVFKGHKLWFGEHKDCPQGYTCPARGSVFIYDECHKVDWIKEKSGTLSTDPTCISMNEHGHEDYIFILITQFPQYLHTHLRGLVEYHYHAKRFNGAKSSKIYKWNEFVLNPRADKSLKDAYEVEKFPFNKRYQACYQSASAHDSMRLNIPKPFIYTGLGLIFVLGLFVWRYLNSPIADMVAGKEGATFSGVKQTSATSAPDAPQRTIINETAEQANEANALARAQFENAMLRRKLELYEQRLPKDYAIVQNEPALQVRAVFSNGTECKAYNAYGHLMTLSFEDCERYLKEPGRIHRAPSAQQHMNMSGQNQAYQVVSDEQNNNKF